jgi:hypothetical protein
LKKFFESTLSFWVFLLALVIIMLCLNACSPYAKIAKNANPTDKERSLLAIACKREFPSIDKPFTTDSVTSNYKKQLDSLNNVVDVLDSIIHDQQPIIDTAFVDSSNCLPRIKIAFSEIARLNDQRNFLQASINELLTQLGRLKLDTIFRSKTIIRCDSAAMQILRDGFKGKSDSLLILNTKYEGSKKQAKTELWIIIGLGIALVTGIVLQVNSVWKKKLV